MTSTTISQSLEASWHHMKKLLPGNVAKMPATDALNHILKATEAWDCAKGSAVSSGGRCHCSTCFRSCWKYRLAICRVVRSVRRRNDQSTLVRPCGLVRQSWARMTPPRSSSSSSWAVSLAAWSAAKPSSRKGLKSLTITK